MAVPSFEALLEQAKQISQYKADQAGPQTGELLASGLANLGHQFLNAPLPEGAKQTYVGSVNPNSGGYTSFKEPVSTGGNVSDLFARKLFGQGEATNNVPPGSVPITQQQFADKGLANIFKPKASLEKTLGELHPGATNEDLENLYGVKGLTPSTTFNQLKAARVKPTTIRGAEPVIASKLATRESVNENLAKLGKQPLAEDEDMARYEYDKMVGELRAKQTNESPKNIPSDEVDKITKVRTAIDGSNEIRTQFFNLVGKGKSPVDPVGGRFADLAKTLGVLDDSEVTKFQTDLVAQMNTYLNSISGAAITEQEAQRLVKRLPKIGTKPEQFLGEMDSFDGELKRSLSARIKTLKDANYRIGDLEKFIIGGKQGGKSTGERPPLSSFEGK